MLIRLVAHRLALIVPMLLAASVLTFVVLDALPGNAAQQLLGLEATEEQIAALETRLNLTGSAHERYFRWLSAAVKGDLGASIASSVPVTTLIFDRLAVTFMLTAYALALALALAVPTAILCVRYRETVVDRLFSAISFAGLSVPNYVIALILILTFAVGARLFPSIGYAPLAEGVLASIRSLTLPAISIAFPLYCLYSRYLRSDLAEQMDGEDYTVSAAARGLGPLRVLLRHALKNSLFGLLTLVGLHLGTLISGAVIIEQIFALPGIGQLLLQAITNRDAAVVQAIVLLITLVIVIGNLSVDVLYSLLDPRVRYASR